MIQMDHMDGARLPKPYALRSLHPSPQNRAPRLVPSPRNDPYTYGAHEGERGLSKASGGPRVRVAAMRVAPVRNSIRHAGGEAMSSDWIVAVLLLALAPGSPPRPRTPIRRFLWSAT